MLAPKQLARMEVRAYKRYLKRKTLDLFLKWSRLDELRTQYEC